MRVELVDDKGISVQSSRNLIELQQAQRAVAIQAIPIAAAGKPAVYDWTRTTMDTWDIENLPSSVVELRGGVRLNMYPTLFVVKEKIATGLVDHEPFAEQLFRRGMTSLFSKIERREIRSQTQFLPQWTTSSLWLSDRYAGDRLKELVGDLMARLAFIDTNWTSEKVVPVFRTKVEFEISRLKRIERVAGAAAEIGRWLPRIAEANHKVRSLLEKTPAAWAENVRSIRDQLTALFHESLSYHVPWCYVREFPRYLQAIAVRLDRLKSVGPTKDLAIDATASSYWKDCSARIVESQPSQTELQSLPPGAAVRVEPTGTLLEYRWLIEELRVSLYAQQLGTRVSVSPKRLEKLKDQLQ